ncbi:MAG TPA: dTDP-4-dehydrorhamnose reductase [Candidatus Polarisedimenticolaceae bacterium]
MRAAVRVVLFGGTGQLGRALRARAPAGATLVVPGRAEADLRTPDRPAAVVARTRPDLVINAAACNDVDGAEADPTEAFAVNAEAVGAIARAAAAAGARLIHVSTDYVFDGEGGRPRAPGDPTAPVNRYGASKLRGEELAIEALGGRTTVVRTSWLHGPGGRGFVQAILRRLRERRLVDVVADQIGVPTHASGLAAAIWRLADRPEISGILHWTDAGVASRYDQALALAEEAERLGLLQGPWRVRPVRTADRPSAAPRPACSVLDALGTADRLGLPALHWREGLRRTLGEERDGA